MPARVLHVLPHRGGGAESYIDMLERAPGFVHERFYLSSGRTPAEALASVPFRWPRLAARLRAVDLVHCHGDAASTISLPLLAVRRRLSSQRTGCTCFDAHCAGAECSYADRSGRLRR